VRCAKRMGIWRLIARKSSTRGCAALGDGGGRAVAASYMGLALGGVGCFASAYTHSSSDSVAGSLLSDIEHSRLICNLLSQTVLVGGTSWT